MRLLLFIHPHCPCSDATLRELAWILERAPHSASFEIYFVRPHGMAVKWGESRSWRSAKAMVQAEVRIDDLGRLASKFGATTSGHLILYDSVGEVLFCGGITAKRGHEGDNVGRRKLLDRLLQVTTVSDSHFVFGCRLFSPCEECAKVDEL